MKRRISVIARVFVEADDQEAQAIADRLRARIEGAPEATVEPYWKEPSWREITLELASEAPDPEAALSLVKDQLGEGWTLGSEGATAFAVWSPGEGARFVEPSVRFANLEVSVESYRRSIKLSTA